MSYLDLNQLKDMSKAELIEQLHAEIGLYQLDTTKYAVSNRTAKDAIIQMILQVRTDGGEPNPELGITPGDADEAMRDSQATTDEPIVFEDFEEVAEVTADAVVAKPKKAKKEKAPKAPTEPRQRRYTNEQILEMVRLVTEAGWKKSKVAKEYGCTGTFVNNVLKGNVYNDVTGLKKVDAAEAAE